MKNKANKVISFVLALCMVFQVSVMASFDNVPGNGTAQSPFKITTNDIATYYSDTGSQYCLSYSGGTYSHSYVKPTANTEASNPEGGQKYNVTIEKLYVVGENVRLNTTLWKSTIPNKASEGTTIVSGGNLQIEGKTTNAVAGDTESMENKLDCTEVDTESGKTYVKGKFKEISGPVIPYADLTAAGDPYIMGEENQPCNLTITSGKATVSGYFKKITINKGAAVTIDGDTVATELDCKGTLSINKERNMCVGGNNIKPSEATLVFDSSTKWGHIPSGKYASAAGSWILDGDVEIKNTSCTCTTDTLVLSKDETHKLTVSEGNVKAAGGTVIAKGGNTTLTLANTTGDVLAYGDFKKINFKENKLTVPANQGISAIVNGNKYGVKPRQNTVFTSFGNELPKSDDANNPFEFDELEGPWNVNSENGDVINGSGAAVTITQDNVRISGKFSSVDSKGHTVILAGDTTINGGEYKVKGTSPYKLSVTAGHGIVSGNFEKLDISGSAEIEDSIEPGADALIINSENEEAIKVSGGKLTLNNSETKIVAQSSSNAIAANVTGGEFYFFKGTLISNGSKANTVYVAKDGKFYFGTDNNKEDYSSKNTPFAYAYGVDSICVNSNNGGEAWLRAGELKFNSANSYGVYVNKDGKTHIYPNDQYGSEITADKALLYIHGDDLAKAAMWVDTGATFDIRGRGALLEGPKDSKNALYIHQNANLSIETPLSGGTYNGKVIYSDKDITKLLPQNFYLRYDEETPVWNSTNGTYGIGSYACQDFIGGYTAIHGENKFNGNYKDTFGEYGHFYTIADAEWELRYNMLNGLDYQIPVGMNSGILLDANVMDNPIWGMGKKQGDVNVAQKSALYLAGKKIDYTGKNCKGDVLDNIAKTENGFASCNMNDALNTITVNNNGDLTIYDGIIGELDAEKYPLKYIGTGTISYSDKVDNKESFVLHNDGTLTVVSGIVTAGLGNRASAVNVHSGATTIGTGNEDDNNNIIKLVCNSCSNGQYNAQGILVSGGTLTLNGAEVNGGDNGILVTSGIVNINGGLIYANWAQGNALYAKGGTTFIHGGHLYGDKNKDQNAKWASSILVDKGNVFLNIDEAHKAYTVDEPSLITANNHHINNILVKDGLLVIGADMLKGTISSNTHNNGTLSLEGGKTIYYDGVTVGNTEVYGADDGDEFTTQLYIQDGDFAELIIKNHEDNNDEYLFLDDSNASFEKNVQIHGGRYSAIDVSNLKLTEAIDATTLIGAWSNEFEYKTGVNKWTRYNHYAEYVTSQRDTDGRWAVNEEINGGIIPKADKRISSDKMGVYVRDALNEIKKVASSDCASYVLHTNIWVGDLDNDGTNICREYKACEDGQPIVVTEDSVVDLNGYGIFGNRSDELIKVEKGTLNIENKNDVQSYIYSNKVQNSNTGANSVAILVDENGSFTNSGSETVRPYVLGNTAIKSLGKTTLNNCVIEGNIGISSSAGTLNIDGCDVNINREGVNTGVSVTGGDTTTDKNTAISSLSVSGTGAATINTTQIPGLTIVNGGSVTVDNGADLQTVMLNNGETVVNGGAVDSISQTNGLLNVKGGDIANVLQTNGNAVVNAVSGKITNYEIQGGAVNVEGVSAIDTFKKVGGSVALNGGKYMTIDAGTDKLSTIIPGKVTDNLKRTIEKNSYLLAYNSILKSDEYAVDEQGTMKPFDAPFTVEADVVINYSGGGGGGSISSVKVVINDGVKETSSNITVGKKISTIKKPTKDKYIFDGWYTDSSLETAVNENDTINKATTLFASFKPDPAYSIVMGIDKNDAVVFGKNVRNDVSPIIRNNRTMLPSRFIAENLGASVEWDSETRTVVIVSNDGEINIRLTIDSNVATINDKEVQLDSPAFIENSRTYTPVRFIAEALGAEVEWDNETKEVVIIK